MIFYNTMPVIKLNYQKYQMAELENSASSCYTILIEG